MSDGIGKCFNCERLKLKTFTYGKIVKTYRVIVNSEIRYYCSKCFELWNEIDGLTDEENKRYLEDLINFGDNELAKIRRSKFTVVT